MPSHSRLCPSSFEFADCQCCYSVYNFHDPSRCVAVRRGEVQATPGQDQMGPVRACIVFRVRRPVVPQVVREGQQSGRDRERVRRGQHVHPGATSGRRLHRLRHGFRVSTSIIRPHYYIFIYLLGMVRRAWLPERGSMRRCAFLEKVTRGGGGQTHTKQSCRKTRQYKNMYYRVRGGCDTHVFIVFENTDDFHETDAKIALGKKCANDIATFQKSVKKSE